MKDSPLKSKSIIFAIRIVRLAQYLQKEHNEFVISKQILKSGTSIGALIREAEFAQSNSDYINKFSISLKEANETDYRLNILIKTDYIDEKLFKSLASDCNELISMLIATINTCKKKIKVKK